MAGYRWSNNVTGASSTFGLGSSLAFFPNIMTTPFNIGISCVVNSSNVSFNVEHTYDYTGSSAFISSNATWFPLGAITGAASNVEGSYSFPVSGIRLNVTSGSSTGIVKFTAIQAGV